MNAAVSVVGSSRQGRCYELAGYAVMSTLVDAVLVHGTIRIPGSSDPAAPYEHAWVVLADGRVWDPTQARLLGAGLFWCVLQPVVANTYTHAELHPTSMRTGHWGPWR
jgi:hypothetical protein